MWQGLMGLGRFGPQEKKNPFSKWAGSGPRILANGSDPSMKKPNLLPFLDPIMEDEK